MAATNINRVIITGNLTRDPELRSTPGGTSVCSLRVAVNSRRKDERGQWVDKPNYFDVTVWGAQGENCAQYLAKGRPVAVDGRLNWREWEARTAPSGSRWISLPTRSSSWAPATRPRRNGAVESDLPADTSDFQTGPAWRAAAARTTTSRSRRRRRVASARLDNEVGEAVVGKAAAAPEQQTPQAVLRTGGRRKSCHFCRDKVDQIDYKDFQSLRRYLSDKGKIRSRRITGACRRHQNQLATRRQAGPRAGAPAVRQRAVGRPMAQAILLKDVEGLGEAGAVVDVSPGYLRNYLAPQQARAGRHRRRRSRPPGASASRPRRPRASRRSARRRPPRCCPRRC